MRENKFTSKFGWKSRDKFEGRRKGGKGRETQAGVHVQLSGLHT